MTVARVDLLSPHGIALARLAERPRTRLRDIADELDVSERAAQRLVADLIGEGLVRRSGVGPQTRYLVPAAVRDGILGVSALRTEIPETNGSSTKREEIRTRLLHAADRELSAAETFAELSIERLITAAGISRSTFYAYFQDKGALLEALTEGVLDEMWAVAIGWTELPADAGKNDIVVALREVIAVYRTHRLVMAAAADSPAVREDYSRLMYRTIDRIADHIARGQAVGFVRPEIDPFDTATLLTWGTERGLNKLVAHASDDEVARVLTALADIVWNLLYAGHR